MPRQEDLPKFEYYEDEPTLAEWFALVIVAILYAPVLLWDWAKERILK